MGNFTKLSLAEARSGSLSFLLRSFRPAKFLILIALCTLSGSLFGAVRTLVASAPAPSGSTVYCAGATSGSYTNTAVECVSSQNGNITVTYQWNLDGTLISGATG